MKRIACWVLSLLAGVGFAVPARSAENKPQPIKFDRDVRPIISENCFACHGPDAHKRKAKLRLDMREGAMVDHDGTTAIVPGNLAKSELVTRITSTDPDEKMPPPESGKKLTAAQIDLLKRWIVQGAEYPAHWAFTPVARPQVPNVSNPAWVKNPIDAFILSRLDKEGLKPSPEADRITLIRRLTLDLTGLPPTPAEVDAFVNDPSPDAYEKLVDRLLANPHYGERMTMEWLDAARFADTHGYHIDSGRDMTAWRDEVIRSYNQNQPFDQFTIEQLAGDMLPNATLDQKIASGFNRNHMINFEGGAVPEEYHTAYLIDRVSTTSTVWLGLTLNCTQCHDHKFDPFTQKDFYSLYAFFNNVPENGLDGAKGNATPILRLPSPTQQKKLDQFAAQIKENQQRLSGADAALDQAQAQWEKTATTEATLTWQNIEPAELKSAGGASFVKLEDHSIRVTGNNPPRETYTIVIPPAGKKVTAIRVEILPEESLVNKGPGRSDNGNIVMTEAKLAVAQKPVKFKSATADFSQQTFPASNLVDGNASTGWAIYPEVGKPHYAILALQNPAGPGDALTLTLEFQSIFAQHQPGRFRISTTDAPEPTMGHLPANISSILAAAPEKRTDAQKAALRTYFRTTISSDGKALAGKIAQLRKEEADFERTIPSTMVMQEMDKPRDTFILIRGQYDKKGDKVTANTPAMLPPMAPNLPHNRLGLAKWLVSRANPLPARVTVNRFWQMYFGTGIVKTAEDFGSQGEYPSHRELLDWLAAQFMDSGWNVKAMQRLIVTSATYRQSSVSTPELNEKDPENRLLARGPRFRLEAEFIRDLALSASGLLSDEIGGRSVSPYQPAGLWEELMSRADGANWTAQVYKQDHGKDLYKRTMYTFWKRTSPPPTLLTFDAPDREVCTVRRSRTNTPLQALVLMNDPTYVEASRKLAERMLHEGGSSPEERITFAYRLTLSRKPQPREIAILTRLQSAQLDTYKSNPPAAEKLLKVGESPTDPKLNRAELASWTMVASTILNLDETMTKN